MFGKLILDAAATATFSVAGMGMARSRVLDRADYGFTSENRPARLSLEVLSPCSWVCAIWLTCSCAIGCASSPTHAGNGAVFGGLLGGGVGALVGEAVGHPGAGALLGAGVGALSGAAVGSGLDDIEDRNRAQIFAQTAHQVPAGAVTTSDVIAMSDAGVSDSLIINHIHAHGSARYLETGDIIMLQRSRVSTPVIQALQSAPVGNQPVYSQASYGYPYYPPPPPRPVIVQERYVVGPAWGYRRPCGPRCWGPPPRPGWGVEIGGTFR